jgi:hypothetical protein
MVVSQVGLGRVKELLLVVSRESRPALAVSDSPVPLVDCGHVPIVLTVQGHRLRPAERVAACHLGVHRSRTMQR